MKAALQSGVLSVSLEADQRVFQNYSTGIFDSTSCGTSLDHATAVVGWGTQSGVEYWIMRNSWGTSWGEAGYMKMEITSGHGICGVQMEPLYPTV
jgi:C1A family cysteine protease